MITISAPMGFKGSKIPLDPGVYLFKDGEGEIIYIGKAKSLRPRVSSYFSKSIKPLKTMQLVSNIRSIDWIIVDSEVEALLLENRLIKYHLPRYNISLKDDKTYAYIALTREAYPRIFTSRKTSSKIESFGPYIDEYMRQKLMRLVIEVFKLRVCEKFPKRACLNFHMNMCTAPCTGCVSKEQYGEQVEQARSFLRGKYQETLRLLASQMRAASKAQLYERALELRNQMDSIQLLTQRQIVDNERRFDQDIIAFRRFGNEVYVVQMRIRRGVLLGKREFSADIMPDVEQEFLKAFYSSNQIPREIIVNRRLWSGGAEKAALEEFLSAKREGLVTLTLPKRGDKLSLVELAEKNLESTLGEDSALIDLQTSLNLPVVPHAIECFDISNLGEEHVVSGMVRFTNGKPDKRNYRRFRMKTVSGQDDFASMSEVIKRRYMRLRDEKAQMPDLVVVDGGSGQVAAANEALHALGLQIPLIGIAKEREEIYVPNEPYPKQFDRNCGMMLLLRQIRDATHDFSLSYNRQRRRIKMRSEFQTR